MHVEATAVERVAINALLPGDTYDNDTGEVFMVTDAGTGTDIGFVRLSDGAAGTIDGTVPVNKRPYKVVSA